MTDAAMPGAPPGPAPTAAAPPPPTIPVAPPPPPAPPPLSTLLEKSSQLAGKIDSQPQFEAALSSVGGAALPAEDKGKIWDTVQKTRIGQGLPPMTIPAPGAPPGGAPVVGGAAPVPPAAVAALPPSVTGQTAGQNPGGNPPAPSAGAVSPGQNPGQPVPPPPAGLKQVPGQDAVPVTEAPPAPTAKYQAPHLATADYKAPTYEPPKKGLMYAAAALALLFPGSQIGRAAGAFAGGLNVGANQKFQRETETAKNQYEADKAKDATINEGRLAQASGNLTAAQAQDKWLASKQTADHQTQVDIYNDRQQKRAQGMDPNTGKPFVPPAALAKPPDPKQGYDGLAAWHQARALWFGQQGASGPQKDEEAAAKEATTQATNAANNARSLFEAAQRAKQEIAIHNDTEANENARHDDTVRHEDARALLADSGRRAEYGVKASAADKSLFTTWQQYTKPQTKTVEIKDVNGNVTGIHTVPMVDANGAPVPPPISGQLQQTLTRMVNLVRNDRDPAGAAAYYSAHLGNDAGGLAGQEILQQAGEAGNLRLMASGRMPQEHAWPKITEPAGPDPFKAAGINAKDPAVKKQIDAAHAAGVTDDATIISTLKAHGIGGPAAPATPAAPSRFTPQHTGVDVTKIFTPPAPTPAHNYHQPVAGQ